MDDGPHYLRFDQLTEPDATEVARWLEYDAAGQREFGGFYGVHPKWWRLVVSDDCRHGWIVCLGDERCGFVDLEVHTDGGASVAIYVRPHLRNRGMWRSM